MWSSKSNLNHYKFWIESESLYTENWIWIAATLHQIWILTRSKMKRNPFNLVTDYESLQTSQTNSNHWKLFHFKQIRDHVKLQSKSESLRGLNRSGKLNLNHFSLLIDLESWQKMNFNHSKLTINHICDCELLLRMRSDVLSSIEAQDALWIILKSSWRTWWSGIVHITPVLLSLKQKRCTRNSCKYWNLILYLYIMSSYADCHSPIRYDSFLSQLVHTQQ